MFQQIGLLIFRANLSLRLIKWGVVLVLHRATSALCSPQAGLTSEFGMGSGGTPPP